jgi:tetratricopeptide (TPR) repeat protein/tRNA A-37 threonylcarbamoyl transferase component Bud32
VRKTYSTKKKIVNKKARTDTYSAEMASRSKSDELSAIAATIVERHAGNSVRRRRDGLDDDADTADMPLADAGATTAEAEPGQAVSDRLVKSRIKSALFHKPRQTVKISRFVLLERIAVGGMGEVYAAYDAQLDRKVAIKLLRPEVLATRTRARERLLREAQALARLSHPNVVQVYEAGEAGKQVYLAMELVHGLPLDKWLKQHAPDPNRDWRIILDTFLAAGRGLAAVHAVNLLHRDFKPANVLVGTDGRVCVVDFGLARAALEAPDSGQAGQARQAGQASPSPSLPGATDVDLPVEVAADASRRLTMSGMLVGTPAYMAPEQINVGEVDHRSDQFSFCVTLYEALYGIRPFDGEDFLTLRNSVTSGEIQAPPADSRVPGWIGRVLARGLATERDQRYPSMVELLAALDRVTTRKRQRWMAAAALLCVGMLGGGGVVIASIEDEGERCAAAARAVLDGAWSPDTADRVHAAFLASNLPYAETIWQSIDGGVQRYVARWQEEREAACRATHVDEIQTRDELVLRKRCLDAQASRLRTLIDRLERADARLVENALVGLALVGTPGSCGNLRALERAAALPEDPLLHPRLERIHIALDQARLHTIAGDFDLALALIDEQIAAAEALDHAPALAEALYHAGDILLERGHAGDVERGTEHLQRALDLAERNGDDPLTADIWNALVRRREASQDPTQVLFWARRALAAAERIDDRGERRALALANLGTALYRQQRHAEAERHQREAIDLAERAGASPLLVADMLHALANTLHARMRYPEARTAYERAVGIARAKLGDEHPQTQALLFDFADFLIQSAEPAAGEQDGASALDLARTYLETARAIRAELHGPESTKVAKVLVALVSLELQNGAFHAAEEHALQALAIYERALGRDHADLAEPLMFAGLSYFHLERYDDALRHWLRERDLRTADARSQPEELGVNQSNIGEALVRLGRHDDALAAFEQAQHHFDRSSEVHPWYVSAMHKGRGQALLGKGRPAEAVRHLELALELLDEPPDPRELADTQWALAQALAASGHGARARALAVQARNIYAAVATTRGRADAIDAWLRR